MTIHIGITGTRNGCTVGQLEVVNEIFRQRQSRAELVFFHHGDCIGVDEESHGLAAGFGFVTVSHPPLDDRLRAFCKADVVHYPMPYRIRNMDIVRAVSLLLVVPEGPEAEHPRSGTWATYRMAVRDGVKTVVIMP